jgi:hypothetical protein
MRRVLVAFALVLSGCAAPMFEMTLTPRYSQSRERLPAAAACGGLAKISASDERSDKTAGGVRFTERAPSERYAIKLDADGTAWAQSGIESALMRAGLALAMPGRPTMDLKLQRMELEEQAARNSTYTATVRYEVSLKNGDKTCFNGAFEGSDQKYGRPGLVDNMREALNGAFDRAALQLLNNQAFLDALCTACGTLQKDSVVDRK